MIDLIEQLTGLGFSEYEAKAYITLQRLRSATGYQVAKESGIPRSMIYQVLDKLIARGAVLTQSFGELVRYAPDPPELLLARMQNDYTERVTHLNASLQEVGAASFGPGQVWNIEGRRNILARAREMIENATREIAVSVGDDDELDNLVVWLRRAQARGIAPAVVAPGPYDAGDLPVRVHPHGLRMRQAVGHGLSLAVDGREALIGETDRSESAVWTTNGYAVAWVDWCIRNVLAEPAGATGQPAPLGEGA